MMCPHWISTTSNITEEIYGGLLFPEKTDFVSRCRSVDNANAIITSTWDMHIIPT